MRTSAPQKAKRAKAYIFSSFWRSAISASCPHAASMSEPFSLRSVHDTPFDFKALKNAFRLSELGLFQSKPSTLL